MLNVRIIIGDAMFQKILNDKIQAFTRMRNIVSVQTTGFSARDRHKTDYVIVTLVYNLEKTK